MSLISQLESILFVASKPLTVNKLAKAVQKKESEVSEALESLKLKYNGGNSGIHILSEGDKIQMATDPANAGVVDLFIKDEASGELTKAQLETLTVIAYRGPITRPELEQIRGVNCALILRNLLIRGLIEETEDPNKILLTYGVSIEALRHLGVNSVAELPDYEKFYDHEFITNILEKND